MGCDYCSECGLEEECGESEIDVDYQCVTKLTTSVPSKGLCVKGRLKENISFWRSELAAPSAVLSTIETGHACIAFKIIATSVGT